jgi:hypothetical protein
MNTLLQPDIILFIQDKLFIAVLRGQLKDIQEALRLVDINVNAKNKVYIFSTLSVSRDYTQSVTRPALKNMMKNAHPC